MTAKGPSFKIVVIEERCKECLMCINVCSKKVLQRGDRANSRGFRLPFSPNPGECVGCRMCEYVCPDFAIYVKPSEMPAYHVIMR